MGRVAFSVVNVGGTMHTGRHTREGGKGRQGRVLKGGESVCHQLYIDTGYRFKDQLLELERVSEGEKSGTLGGAEAVVSPLKWQEWERELEEHPDKEWMKFLVRGIRAGFRLGHDQSVVEVTGRRGGMYKALEHKAIIDEYLAKEERARRIWRVSSSVDKGRV